MKRRLPNTTIYLDTADFVQIASPIETSLQVDDTRFVITADRQGTGDFSQTLKGSYTFEKDLTLENNLKMGNSIILDDNTNRGFSYNNQIDHKFSIIGTGTGSEQTENSITLYSKNTSSENKSLVSYLELKSDIDKSVSVRPPITTTYSYKPEITLGIEENSSLNSYLKLDSSSCIISPENLYLNKNSSNNIGNIYLQHKEENNKYILNIISSYNNNNFSKITLAGGNNDSSEISIRSDIITSTNLYTGWYNADTLTNAVRKPLIGVRYSDNFKGTGVDEPYLYSGMYSIIKKGYETMYSNYLRLVSSVGIIDNNSDKTLKTRLDSCITMTGGSFYPSYTYAYLENEGIDTKEEQQALVFLGEEGFPWAGIYLLPSGRDNFSSNYYDYFIPTIGSVVLIALCPNILEDGSIYSYTYNSKTYFLYNSKTYILEVKNDQYPKANNSSNINPRCAFCSFQRAISISLNPQGQTSYSPEVAIVSGKYVACEDIVTVPSVGSNYWMCGLFLRIE